MRWLPRRRRDEHRDAPPPSPGPAAERTSAGPGPAERPAAAPAGPRTEAGPSGTASQWRRLPPLPLTVRRAPVTAAATMGVLAEERIRPLIHPAGSGRSPAGTRRGESGSGHPEPDESAAVEPAAGRVTGLATVRAEPPEEPEAPVPAPAPARRRGSPVPAQPLEAPEPPPAPRLAPRILPSAGPRPSLLKAADEYVGAPEPDTSPYASSAWLRMVESYRPPWANGPADGSAAAQPDPFALPPIPEAGSSWSSEVAAAPPRVPRAARPEGSVPQRRASLAESRRLGLGNPLRPSAARESSPDGPADSQGSQDPAESQSSSDSQTQGSESADSERRDSAPQGSETQGPGREDSGSQNSGSQDSQSQAAGAAVSPADTAAPPAGPAELRLGRPERAASPDLSAPATDPAAGTRDEPGTSGGGKPDGAARPRPRLGLGAPIVRPPRPARDASPSLPSTPAPPLPAPTRQDPAPSPPPSAATGKAPNDPAANRVELVRPAQPRRAEPVYRFVPAERPTRADAPSPAAPPADASFPATPASASASATSAASSPSPADSPAAPALPLALGSPSARPAAAAATPAMLTLPTVSAASPIRPLTAAEAAAFRPLTHPRAQRGPGAGRAEAEASPWQSAAAPVQAPAPAPVPAVPADLLDAVRQAHGVDVSDVPIRREPEVADEARSLGARSFTRDAEVFLPQEQGAPQDPVARGLLAHELTHAAQQRLLGSALPAEDSDAGRALEAQAVAAERWARGLGGPPPAAPGAAAASPQGASWSAPWQAPPTHGVQRQSEDVATMPDFAAETAPGSGFAQAPDSSGQPGAETAPPAGTYVDDELGSARDRLLELSRRRPLDLDDPGDIEELSVRIYQRIHRKLRRELLVERERAGRLGETGPFGSAR